MEPNGEMSAENGQKNEDAVSTSVERAADELRQRILSGHYEPGERVKVADLSRELGFGAMPLREALRKLEGQGLVEIAPNRGAVVRSLDRRYVEDLFELNTELRIFAARRGMRMLTIAKLDELSALADAYDAAVEAHDLQKGLVLNRQFHTMIVRIGGNAEALRVFERGWEMIGAFRSRFGYGAGRETGLAREKHLIVEALRRQDLVMVEAIFRMQHAAAIEDLLGRLSDDGSNIRG
jgi:DNA-binding GntR family transcriptional regulator